MRRNFLFMYQILLHGFVLYHSPGKHVILLRFCKWTVLSLRNVLGHQQKYDKCFIGNNTCDTKCIIFISSLLYLQKCQHLLCLCICSMRERERVDWSQNIVFSDRQQCFMIFSLHSCSWDSGSSGQSCHSSIYLSISSQMEWNFLILNF